MCDRLWSGESNRGGCAADRHDPWERSQDQRQGSGVTVQVILKQFVILISLIIYVYS